MKLIAIVDDQSANRAVFGRLAKKIAPALKVESFASAEEALAYFNTGHHPDMVITDFRMTGMDGAEFISALRETPWAHDVPVIVITAYEDRAHRLEALRAGATDFLLAPVDHGEFVSRGKNLLHMATSRKHAKQRATALERELADSHRARNTLLRRSRQHLLQVIDTVPAMISATDESGKFVFVNRCMAESMRSTPEALTGSPAPPGLEGRRCASARWELKAPPVGCCGERRPCCEARYEEIVRDTYGAERVFLTSETPLEGSHSDAPLWLRTSLDITDLKAAQERLHFLAYRDQLTGTPNRLMIEKTIQALLSGNGKKSPSFALFMLDLDRFKAINDTLGHSIGDRVLKSVAGRLETVLPDAVVVGRLGGDEFGIVLRLTGTYPHEEARERAVTIRDAFIPPFAIGPDDSTHPDAAMDDSVVITTASIGIVVHQDASETVDMLLKRADMAMYKAKTAGGNTFELFHHEMEDAEAAAMRIELDLQSVVTSRELILHYQPQIDLRSGKIIGVEALLRWQRPDGTLLLPATFLPVAEETGLIVPITEWVLNEACRQQVAWTAEDITVRMAVNMSGVLFRRADIRNLVMDVIERTGINPVDLELELTESVLIGNTDTANRQLADLRKLGAAVAVDDFGTGYASLTYLSRLVIDRIKIDKSFIDRIENSPSDQAIVRSMIDLCRKLEIKVTTEGIERPEQARWLARQRCDEGQGYYFGRPQPADKIAEMFHTSMKAAHRDEMQMCHISASEGGPELAP